MIDIKDTSKDLYKKVSKLETERRYIVKKIKQYEKKLLEITDQIREIYLNL